MIRSIYKKDGSFTKTTMNCLDDIRWEYRHHGKIVRIHPKKWSGRGLHAKLINNQCHYTDILDEFKVPYFEGNDAPRGSVTGDFIEFKIDLRNKFWKGVL